MIRSEILSKAGEHEDWELHLPFVTMNLNTTIHVPTGFSPHYIVFGQEKRRSGAEYRIFADVNPEHTNCRERREAIFDETAESLRAAFEKGKERYNLRGNVRSFNVGDEVYLKNRKLSKAGERYTKKLAQLKIKARITEKVGSDTYRLADPRTNDDFGVYNAADIYTR